MQRINIPANVRLTIYIITGALSPVVAVLTMPDVHVLPSWFSLIWAGEVTFVGTMAGLNVGNSGK